MAVISDSVGKHFERDQYRHKSQSVSAISDLRTCAVFETKTLNIWLRIILVMAAETSSYCLSNSDTITHSF